MSATLGMINSMIFPAPSPTYGLASYPGQLVHIPRYNAKGGVSFTCGLLMLCPEELPEHPVTHLLLYAHPNAVDVGMMKDEMEYLQRRLHVHVLVYEFQGYGLCEGGPSAEETTADTEAAFDFARKVLQVAADKIIFMGRSIGTGPTADICARLSTEERPALLVLEAPFTSIKECVRSLARQYAGGLVDFACTMVGNRFNTIGIIADVECPILIIHGLQDEIVSYEHGTKLTAAAKLKKEDVLLHTIPDCGHNNIPLSEEVRAIAEAIQQFSIPVGEGRPSLVVNMPGCYLVNPLFRGGKLSSFVECQSDPNCIEVVAERIAAQLPGASLWEAQRSVLPVPLALSTIDFVCRAHKEWVRRKSSSAPADVVASQVPLAPETFVDQCCGRWGSPFGLYAEVQLPTGDVPSGATSPKAAARMTHFGFYQQSTMLVKRNHTPSTGAAKVRTLLVPVRAWQIPRRLFAAMAKLMSVSSQQSVAPNELPVKFVDLVQLECERFVIGLPQSDWDDMQGILSYAGDATQAPFLPDALKALLFGAGPQPQLDLRSRVTTPMLREWTTAAAQSHASEEAFPWSFVCGVVSSIEEEFDDDDRKYAGLAFERLKRCPSVYRSESLVADARKKEGGVSAVRCGKHATAPAEADCCVM